ncbi:MAG: hypothetical protein CL847_05355 [Crocinitomicaceae bacterium]|nr:hypothetical protein [Crocinitomicaceae bacterium]
MSTSPIKTDIRGLIDIALPISVGTFVQFLVLLTDNYFLARVGENAINGAGNAGLTYLTFGMLIFGSATGIQILVARRKGEGDEQMQIRTGSTGLLINTFIGVGLWVILLLLNNGFLGALIHTVEVKNVFESYLGTRLWGSVPYGITFAMTAYWTGIARTRLLLAVSLSTAFSNLFLDYVLIEGNLGFEAMGHIGAARASLAAETLGFIVAVVLMLKVEPLFFKLPKKMDGEIIKAWWNISGPLMGQLLLTVGVWTSFFFFVEKTGSTQLKVSHIGRNAFMFAFIVTSGLGQTTRTVIATLIGAKRQNELIPTIKRLWVLNIAGVIILSHGFILYPELIASLFFADQEHIAMMSRTFTTLFIAVLGYGSAHILLTTLEGAGGTKKAFAVEMLGAVMYLSAMIYLTTPINGEFYPIETIWRVEWIYFTFIILGCYLALRNGKWKTGIE